MPTTTITVTSTARNYEPRWHEKYDAEFKQGDSIEVCELQDGDSIIRRSHAIIAKGTVEKHFESVEDILLSGSEADTVKINVTITFAKGSVSARTRANDLAEGYFAAMTRSRIESLNNGTLNR